jgi:hypothetical protein
MGIAQLLLDDYERVKAIRQEHGYRGRNCDHCPGRDVCIGAWDATCGNKEWGKDGCVELRVPLPCGQRVEREAG